MAAIDDIPGEHTGALDRPKGNGLHRGRLKRRHQGDEASYERWHWTTGGGEAEDQA
jgi:hypothetical protein